MQDEPGHDRGTFAVRQVVYTAGSAENLQADATRLEMNRGRWEPR